MAKIQAQLTGWGAYVPDQVVTNHDLAQLVDTSHDWIVQRTGIIERRIARDGETTATMAMNAGQAALAQAGLAPTDLDLIIVATSTPDHSCPPVSSQIQHGLGAANIPSFVLQNACSGFVYALNTAYQFIGSGAYRNILVIGADMISRFLNWQDRSTSVLFGDGAGAVVLQPSTANCGLYGFVMGSDGRGAEDIIIPAGGAAEPVSVMALAKDRHLLQMNGRAVFKFATNILVDVVQQLLAETDLTLNEIDWIIPHQANHRIIQTAARRLDLPLDRFVTNLDRYGNTWAASIPLALTEALASGQVKPHDRLLLVSFGAGLSWAASLIQMAPAAATPAGIMDTMLAQPEPIA